MSKMKRRGQSAMEYVTTYGWAILVVSVIGVVLWQMGAFNLAGKITPGYSGFSIVEPLEWGAAKNGVGCTLFIFSANGAGETLQNVSMDGNPCIPQSVPAGNTTLCTKTITCGSVGSSFNEEATITYERLNGQGLQSSGKIWGNIENS